MKALTVRHPWAWAIAKGHKPIENRGWVTPHRGHLAIHSAKQFDDQPEDALRMVRDILRAAGTPYPKTFHDALPLAGVGLVLATVDLADVCTASYDTETVVCDCGPWAMPGQAHWRLANARPLDEPVPATGRLGLWEWEWDPAVAGWYRDSYQGGERTWLDDPDLGRAGVWFRADYPPAPSGGTAPKETT